MDLTVTTRPFVLPFWNARIAPELLAGRNVLVAAHGNSLRALMWRNVGITRTAQPLAEAQEIIRFWHRYVMDKIFDSPEGWECQNLLTTSLLVTHAAELRKESRGVHYRTDHPKTDDAHFRKHIEIVKAN